MTKCLHRIVAVGLGLCLSGCVRGLGLPTTAPQEKNRIVRADLGYSVVVPESWIASLANDRLPGHLQYHADSNNSYRAGTFLVLRRSDYDYAEHMVPTEPVDGHPTYERVSDGRNRYSYKLVARAIRLPNDWVYMSFIDYSGSRYDTMPEMARSYFDTLVITADSRSEHGGREERPSADASGRPSP